ncbi:MAG: sigma-70 family RNA polymerase sigma factor [Casimicrobiaceae bacterium]|nr:sigma-70 family RNA polymerase sigma factor [Casimicrobiaceae bacterium]MCX8097653.1 sigma-70 family RNA polymerase sigma factor [Casimicrobiaceae bacterium]MDW8311845.1 sigma-70 family RNA polymerase sigma factor [Burkholderiales bacterium]
MSEPISDQALLAAVAQGDESALKQLHDRHAAALFRFVDRLLDDRGAAEDVVVETFFDVWRLAGSFQSRSSVRTWIFGIARHKALDQLRARGRLPEPVEEESAEEVPDPAATPFERLLAQQSAERLSDCVDALSEPLREAFWLHVVDGLKLRELAELLSIPENTAATRVHHAKRRLRECLERSGVDR